ncbi:Diphthine methyl ester synthase [Blattella germanica]|nr:Diphthine methyl ester synthase [Blattella germanica]
MFYVIGLGLGDAKDISVKGLEIVKSAERVYLESYTSLLTEQFYGRSLIIAYRELVEQGADEILQGADKVDVALLVVGDPFGATTHTDIVLRAKEKGIACKIVHNASIMNAIGCCGLQNCYRSSSQSVREKHPWTTAKRPRFDYHIRVKEPTLESLTMKKKQYMPPKFMSVCEAADQLLRAAEGKKNEAYTEDTLCVGVARVGSDTQQIVARTLQEMKEIDLGPPLHSLVITGHLHPLEIEYLEQFALMKEQLQQLAGAS